MGAGIESWIFLLESLRDRPLDGLRGMKCLEKSDRGLRLE
jgi:hypothetical protein